MGPSPPSHLFLFSVFLAILTCWLFHINFNINWSGCKKKQNTYLFIFKFDGPFSLQIQVFFFFFFTSGKLSWAPASAVTFYCFGSSRALLCVAVPSLPPSSVSVSSCFVPGRLELFVPFLPFQLFSSISSVPFISFFFFWLCWVLVAAQASVWLGSSGSRARGLRSCGSHTQASLL